MVRKSYSRVAALVSLVAVAAGLCACGNSPHDLARWGRLDDLKAQVQRNPQKLEALDPLDKTPLFFTVITQQEEVARWLVEQGADVNHQDRTGLTAMHAAARWNQVPMIRVLHDLGGDVNARDAFGGTPLHAAAYSRRHEAIEALLQLGADPDIENNNGFTAEELAREELYPETAAFVKSAARQVERDPGDAG